MLKTTPLYEEHVALKARFVAFANYSMPVFYEGIRQEHLAVRQKVGIFDVSHMGEIRVRGKESLSFLEAMTTNSVARLQSGQAQYNLLLNNRGGIVDDFYLYCLERERDYLLCVNASNDEKAFRWLKEHSPSGAEVTSETEVWAQLAVQGPVAPRLISDVLNINVAHLPKNRMICGVFQGTSYIYATSGYTGENGGEIFIENSGARALWRALFAHSVAPTPCGLGARDTLRLEMGYPLYGQELTEDTSPLEAGLQWAVKSNNKDFIGKNVLSVHALNTNTFSHKLVGFVVKDRAIARSGYSIVNQEQEKIGWVTSGTLSPSLEKSIGLGYVALPWTSVGSQILIEIRDRRVEAEVVSLPFYQAKKEMTSYEHSCS